MNILKILDNIYGDVSGVGWANGAAAQGRRVREAAERTANECFKFRKKKKLEFLPQQILSQAK